MPGQGLGGFASLGNAIGGGDVVNGELAYANGQSLGAKTLDALAQARQRVDENNARETADAALKDAIPDPATRAVVVNRQLAGGTMNDATDALLGAQKLAARTQSMNMNTPDDQVARNSIALGQPAQFLHTGPDGEFTNELHPSQGVQQTDVGQAIAQGHVADLAASANQKNAAAAVNNQIVQHGGKAPAGFRFDGVDENGNPKVAPITGSATDPNSPNFKPPGGGVSARFTNRVISSADLATADLANLTRLKAGASGGVFGIGSQPGENALQSTVDSLRNRLSDQDVQSFNTRMSGLQRNLGAIETQGMMVPGSLTNAMNGVVIRSHDTQQTRMEKLAEARQIIEHGVTFALKGPGLVPEQKQYLQDILGRVQQAVPFTIEDVDAMPSAPKGMTLAQMAAQRLKQTGSVTGPSASTPTFATEADATAAEAAGKLQKNTPVIIGGQKGTWQ